MQESSSFQAIQENRRSKLPVKVRKTYRCLRINMFQTRFVLLKKLDFVRSNFFLFLPYRKSEKFIVDVDDILASYTLSFYLELVGTISMSLLAPIKFVGQIFCLIIHYVFMY